MNRRDFHLKEGIMGRLKALFDFEVKRYFFLRGMVVLVVLILLTGYVVNKGIDRYLDVLRSGGEFRQTEARMFERIRNYTHYSFHGIGVYYMPAASSILLGTGEQELTARVDSVASLDIYKDYKGRQMPVFSRELTGTLNFAFLVLLLCTLLPLLMGYEGMLNRGYLKFLASGLSSWKVLLTVIFARFFILVISLIIVFSCLLALMALRGIILLPADYYCLSAYLGAVCLMMAEFLIAGAIIGTIEKTRAAVTLILAVWFAFAYLLPAALNTYIDHLKAVLPSSHQIKLKKMDIIKEFEDKGYKKEGRVSRKKVDNFRKLANS